MLLEIYYITLLAFHCITGILFCYQNLSNGNMFAKQGINRSHRCESTDVAAKCKMLVTQYFIDISTGDQVSWNKLYWSKYPDSAQGVQILAQCSNLRCHIDIYLYLWPNLLWFWGPILYIFSSNTRSNHLTSLACCFLHIFSPLLSIWFVYWCWFHSSLCLFVAYGQHKIAVSPWF